VIAARLPSAISNLPGYILLSPEPSPVDGLGEIFRRLDEQAAVADRAFSGSFSAWLARHPDQAR
jgi:hypothetical protein